MKAGIESNFLLASIVVFAVLAFFILKPFIVVLILAGVFAVVLQPLYKGVVRRMGSSPGLAAFLTMLILVVGLLIPLTFIIDQITGDAARVYTSLSSGEGKTYITDISTYANTLVEQYAQGLGLTAAELPLSIDKHIKDILVWIVQNLGGAFGGIVSLLLGVFIFLIGLYYFLRDGSRFTQAVVEASPLADDDDRFIIGRLEVAVNSVIRGSLTIALIQGVLTGIGFALFGIPNSILWGVVAAFAALIPGIGTALVLIPGVSYLFVIGATTPALGLLVWSVVVVGLIDNFLGPRLMGKGTQLHPLIMLLSVFGGLAFFGPVGVFLGPLSSSLLVALFSIYSRISR